MIHHTLNRDVVSGQQARSPPKPGRERDIGTADRHKRIDNDLIKRTDEITSSIERGLGFGKYRFQLLLEGFTNALDISQHFRISREQVREDRQQSIAKIFHSATAHIQIHHRQELGVRSRVNHQGLAAGIGDDTGLRHAVVGMPTQNYVNTAYAAR